MELKIVLNDKNIRVLVEATENISIIIPVTGEFKIKHHKAHLEANAVRQRFLRQEVVNQYPQT